MASSTATSWVRERGAHAHTPSLSHTHTHSQHPHSPHSSHTRPRDHAAIDPLEALAAPPPFPKIKALVVALAKPHRRHLHHAQGGPFGAGRIGRRGRGRAARGRGGRLQHGAAGLFAKPPWRPPAQLPQADERGGQFAAAREPDAPTAHGDYWAGEWEASARVPPQGGVIM